MRECRIILTLLIVCLSTTVMGAHPYDAVCRVDAGGSGVLLYVADGKGLVVTNAHVMPDKAKTVCYWPAKNEHRKAEVVGFHQDLDLCFMVVENVSVKPAKMGIRDTHVVFTGFPHYSRAKLHWQYGNVFKEDLCQVYWKNKPVPGMSGGAVFDRKDGDLCGLVRANDDNNVGVGVCDLALILTAGGYEDPETWVPDGSHVEDYEPSDYNYAKPSKFIRTRKYDKRAPHWEFEEDEVPEPAPVEPRVQYKLLEGSAR